jgi:four helix bundle protein
MLEVGGLRREAKLEMGDNRYVFPFQKLDVWNLAVDMADYVLALVNNLPSNKHLRLISQMEAAIASVAQNIAEGKGRQYKKEFIQFLSIAQGSLYETVTLNEIFRRRKLFSEEEYQEVIRRGEVVDRKLNGLMNSLRGKRRPVYKSDSNEVGG